MKHVKILRILTIMPAFSLAIVSIAGAFFPETYARVSTSLGAQGMGLVESNTNLEGPVIRAVLPRWASDGFILHLEMVGHPEYSSDYTFPLSD